MQTKECLDTAISDSILALHAILGCDTTSRLFSIGKDKALQIFNADTEFRKLFKIFYDANAEKRDIIRNGEKILIRIYGGKHWKDYESLNVLRKRTFITKTATCSKAVRPESLNPTSDSASFHSFRVYHQVQDWLGNELDPTKWGWKVVGGKLFPEYSSKPPAPQQLLKVVRCGCKTDCSRKTCSCLKYGLKCTEACQNCRGISCDNVLEIIEENTEDNHGDYD